MELSCFKAYDIRGQLNSQLDESIAYRIGLAYAEYLQAKSVVVGADVRLTSRPLLMALSAGLIKGGARVYDLGMSGTEEVYFATQYLNIDGGIEVTASHNPIDYNGLKLVSRGAKPISGDSGLHNIRKLAESYSDEAVEEALVAFSNTATDPEAFIAGQSRVAQSRLLASGHYQHISVMC